MMHSQQSVKHLRHVCIYLPEGNSCTYIYSWAIYTSTSSKLFLSDRKLKSIFVRSPLCCFTIYKSIIWTEVAFIRKM